MASGSGMAKLPFDIKLQIVDCLDDEDQPARTALRCCIKAWRDAFDHCTLTFVLQSGEMLPFVLARLDKGTCACNNRWCSRLCTEEDVKTVVFSPQHWRI